jgi:hypothetical protein
MPEIEFDTMPFDEGEWRRRINDPAVPKAVFDGERCVVATANHRAGAPASTPRELAAAIHDALPHGPFETSAQARDGKIYQIIGCGCGRTLQWLGGLPSDILFRWLADHDDDWFLTAEQLAAKHGTTVETARSTHFATIKSLSVKLSR